MFSYQYIRPYHPYKLLTYLMTVVLLLTTDTAAFAAQGAKGKARHVIVTPVAVKQISDSVEALGTARANESVNITSNITEKITRIDFDDGQHVKAGAILAVLEQAEEQAELKRAQAVRGERKLALDRLLQLEERKLTSPDEIDRTRLELEQAEAGITVIKSRISDRVIRAPFDGIVGLRNISVGALVETGDLIATLDDIRQIKLDFTVPSVFLDELKPGLKIKARAVALGNKEYLGEVKSINSRVDPVTRSIQVRALLPNPDGGILPGILMQVELLRNTRQALVIPEAALLPLADRQYVMLRVKKDGKDTVEKKQVKIGLRLPGYVEILDGLSANEQVVTHGNNKVKPGDVLDVLAVDDGSVDISSIIKKQKKNGQNEGQKIGNTP
ncbi:MAG: efflux RND transporter periplasmic adaptor subunit [Gammaproteobacteria bacterium]|nr:efflux RND transporter periplasmic adaptor subunit [Gammaproteobacteria bacterium]